MLAVYDAGLGLATVRHMYQLRGASSAAYVALTRRRGLDPAQMVLAFIASRPIVTASIIGATSLDQFEAHLGSLDLSLTEEEIASIEAIHRG